MTTEKPITLSRDCTAIMGPSGERILLPAGSTAWLTQALGGSYTVMTDRGYPVRIDGRDGDAARARLRGEELAAPELIDLEVTSVF